jgi:hypothetical protein
MGKEGAVFLLSKDPFGKNKRRTQESRKEADRSHTEISDMPKRRDGKVIRKKRGLEPFSSNPLETFR